MSSPSRTHADLLGRAHDLYRTLISAPNWQQQTIDGQEAVDGLQSFRVYRRAAPSSVSFKVVARVLDGKDGIALRPRNFGAVLSGSSGRPWDSIFDEVEVMERLDARTSLQRLTMSKMLSSARDFIVITQTVATSTTFVSLSTSVPFSVDSPAWMKSVLPFVRGQINLLAWVVERAAEWDGLKITCMLDTTPETGLGPANDCEIVVNQIPRSVGAAANHLRNKGFLPYILDYASYVRPLGETYDLKNGTYGLQWEVLDASTPSEPSFSHLGQSGVSILSSGSSSLQPMVEIRIDYRRWVKAGEGLDLKFEANGRSTSEISVEVAIDSEGGWKISCAGDDDRVHAAFSLRLSHTEVPGVTVNGAAISVIEMNPAPIEEGIIRHGQADNPDENGNIDGGSEDQLVSSGSMGAELLRRSASLILEGETSTVPTHVSQTSGISLPIYPHRFGESVIRAFDLFNNLVFDESFKHVSTQKDVCIFKKDVPDLPDHPTGILKGVGTYPVTDVKSIWDIIAVVQTAGARKIWDTNFENDTIVEQLSANSFIIHAMNKGVWPTSPRDATVVSTLVTGDSRIQSLVRSVADDPILPPVKNGNVRAHVDIAGWDIEALSDETIKITHIIQFDPKGWIPSSLISAVSTQLPLTVAAVVDYLKRFGSPPYVIGGLGSCEISRVHYLHEKGQYELAVNPKQRDLNTTGLDQDRYLRIRVDLKTWSGGNIDVEAVSGTSKVDVSVRKSGKYGDDGAILCVKRPQDAETVVKVRKGQPGSGIVVNGQSVEVNELSEAGDAGALVVGSLPVSIPTPRSHSPVGFPTKSLGWESPTGRLSMSALVPGGLGNWSSLADLAQAQDNVDAEGGLSADMPSVLSPAVVPEQVPAVDKDKELRVAGNAALGKLLQLHKSARDWTLVSALRSGLSIHRKTPTAIGQMPIMRGTKVVEGFAPEEVFSVIKAFGCRKIWDDLLEDGKQMQYCGESTRVAYLTMKGFFPLSRRDLVTISADKVISIHPNTSSPTIATAATSVPESLLSPEILSAVAAEAGSKVRGTLAIGGWILEPIDPYEATQQHPIPSTRATVYYQVDLGGSVPQAIYGFMVGSAPKDPANVEAYLKSHGIPPYVLGLLARDEISHGEQRQGKLRVISQDFDHGSNEFVAEFEFGSGWTETSRAKGVGTVADHPQRSETFHMEMDAPGTGTESESEDLEEPPLMLEIIVDLVRYPSGYHVKWETAKLSEAGVKSVPGTGPDLQIDIAEILPPPTHSATHFPTSLSDSVGSSNGGTESTGYESGSESAGGAGLHVKGKRDGLGARNATTKVTPKNKVTKHSIKVRVLRSAIRHWESVHRRGHSPVPPSEPCAFAGAIRVVASRSKKIGVAGMLSSAVGGESTFTVMVNNKRVHIGKHGDTDLRAKEKERLRKKISRGSFGTARSSVIGGSTADTAGSAGQPPLASAKNILNGSFLFSRRRPKSSHSLVSGEEGGIEMKHPLRISSLPASSSSPSPDILKQIPTGGTFGLLSPRSSLAAAGKRRASVATVFPTQEASSPKSDTLRSQHDIKMETPPPFRSDEADSPHHQPGANNHSVEDARSRAALTGHQHSEQWPSTTYSLTFLFLCGAIAFLTGAVLRLFVVDPFSTFPSTSMCPVPSKLPPIPTNKQQCPLVFCPPCPVCASPAATATVTVTVTASINTASEAVQTQVMVFHPEGVGDSSHREL
ncbi:hypothetical protein SpCBS45565_g04687 [Spizellomyces sp. 'palustris']|nr:hypothetical protein SpCBS45565_g04687 [Spizellomyces sp. 'palustris']